MNRQKSVFSAHGAVAVACLCAIGLSACDQVGLPGGSAEQAASGVLRIEEREVERPDIFEMNARGLWDGRPSLGGRWVAVARDIDAETVLIFNKDNDSQIKGALFRVEAGRPGPAIMVSSEAAQALNMLPGAPAEMRVVAVRTETVEVPAPIVEEAVVDEGPDPEAGTETEALDTAPLGTGVLETTVLSALDEADEVVASGTTAAAPAAAGTVAAVTQTTAPQQAAAAAETMPAPRPEPVPAEVPEPDVASPDVDDQVQVALSRPFVQVMSDRREEQAQLAVERLAEVGISSEIRTTGSEQRPLYRVVAGPFDTNGARTDAIIAARGLGFEKPYPIK